ncbi:hypothetical protein [Halalkalicoccus sp. NIPERK01]|uniref:hypothetical protein n=1 Tax=Halalkalicoccus sp. NIPERK01 TaxID=3053469 RepID=UPI00256EDA09|nr:hypothetical protein [Halalkalicoccus sp. NIPERK01]MDL5363756.1 hypothetical protein [Halalkalicoccus sp. NIPERK01]
MSVPSSSLLDRLRKPEYTGENRCTPCTVLNVVIALVASGLLATVAPALAALVFALSLAAIYLRGYLVPGTPRLTKRYLPDRALALFDTHPGEGRRTEEWETVETLDDHRENAVDPERFLLDVDAVEPCQREDDLCLTDGFARLIDRRRGAFEDPFDPGTMAALFDTDPGSIAALDRAYPAVEIDRRVRKWPSEAALVADLLTDDALRELTDRWSEVPLEQRLGILESLRSFHETCPNCGGEVFLGEDTYESCCRSYEVLTIGCVDCEQPLLEFDPEDLAVAEHGSGVRS